MTIKYEWMKKPHILKNEDGREYDHPGYEERRCRDCGVEYLCAVTYIGNTCGHPNCGKEVA